MEVISREREVHNVSGRSRIARIIAKTGLLALFVAGLAFSLHVTFVVHRLDPDMSQSAMLWFGVEKEGWAFLTQWRYTADNWLFSWNLLHFAIFKLFGTDPRYVFLSGWLVFVANALATGAIARALGGRKSALVISSLLLFSGFYAHRGGLTSHPMSHGITNLFGLLMVLCGIVWARKQRPSALAGLILFGLLGGISDPWLLAPYVFPIALAALAGMVFYPRENRRTFWPVLLSMILVTGIIKTRFFGLLDFLPVFIFKLAGWAQIHTNADTFWRSLGGLFCSTFPENPGPRIVALCALTILLSGAAFLLAKRKEWLRIDAATLVFYIPLSLGGIGAALLISNATPASEHSGRFLINWLYLAPVFIAVALEKYWRETPAWFRAFALVCAVAFLVAGIVSAVPYLRPDNPDGNADRLAFTQFLEENGLNYGYGPYWGTMSSAVTWASRQRVVIRPANFSRESGGMLTAYRAQANDFWYRESDAPRGQGRYFVVVKNDGEQCADIPLCIQGLTRQFGNPEQSLTYQDATILVWNHPLVDSPRAIEPGQTLRFAKADPPMLWKGWSDPSETGTWTRDSVAELKLKIPAIPAGSPQIFKLTFEAQCKTADANLFINGRDFGALHFSGKWPQTFTINIPSSLILENDGKLEVQFKRPVTKKNPRKSWLCLSSMCLDPIE